MGTTFPVDWGLINLHNHPDRYKPLISSPKMRSNSHLGQNLNENHDHGEEWHDKYDCNQTFSRKLHLIRTKFPVDWGLINIHNHPDRYKPLISSPKSGQTVV